MDVLVIVLYVLMLLTGLLRLSMFRTRTLVVISILLGLAMWGVTLWLSETDGIGYMRLIGNDMVRFGIIAESLIFLSFCVCYGSGHAGFVKRLLQYYTGVMLLVPFSAMAIWSIMNVTAMSFEVLAFVIGIVTTVVVLACVKITCVVLRYENSRVGILYVTDIAVFLLCIVLSGL